MNSRIILSVLLAASSVACTVLPGPVTQASAVDPMETPNTATHHQMSVTYEMEIEVKESEATASLRHEPSPTLSTRHVLGRQVHTYNGEIGGHAEPSDFTVGN